MSSSRGRGGGEDENNKDSYAWVPTDRVVPSQFGLLREMTALRPFMFMVLFYALFLVVYHSIYNTAYDGSWYDADPFQAMIVFDLFVWPMYILMVILVLMGILTWKRDTATLVRMFIIFSFFMTAIAASEAVIAWVFSSISIGCSSVANRACACDKLSGEPCLLFLGRDMRWTWVLSLFFRIGNFVLILICSLTGIRLKSYNEELRKGWNLLGFTIEVAAEHRRQNQNGWFAGWRNNVSTVSATTTSGMKNKRQRRTTEGGLKSVLVDKNRKTTDSGFKQQVSDKIF